MPVAGEAPSPLPLRLYWKNLILLECCCDVVKKNERLLGVELMANCFNLFREQTDDCSNLLELITRGSIAFIWFIVDLCDDD